MLNLNSSFRKDVEQSPTVSVFSSKLAPGADIGVGFIILSVVLLSIIGNGLVLVISYRRRKRIEGLELLSVNLAAVDFLSCVCMYPLSILSSFNHAWMGNHITCTYYGLGCYVFGLCGMFTIASISVIRYIRTCYSLVYAVWLDSSNIRLVCCGTWLVAAAWSSLPLFGWGEYVPEPYGLSCTVAWRSYHNSFKDAFYVICSFALFTLVPILLIVLSQIHILYRVCHFSHSLSARGVQTKLRRTERRLSLVDVLLHQLWLCDGLGSLCCGLLPLHLSQGELVHGTRGLCVPRTIRQKLPYLQPLHLLLLQQGLPAGAAASPSHSLPPLGEEPCSDWPWRGPRAKRHSDRAAGAEHPEEEQ
ncbi:opsin 8, group member c isoform X2 [Esox lucius]|uniref:opsin 8, group member c isoform X2 n=1 Tax=Esox lucius TaxID=8010 RepID=UPI001477069F|nr:opsin 8, group member c isoform X2 [Esox lucius]